MSPLPACTVEWVQACSTSRSFMAAPSQRQTLSCRCLVMAASTLHSPVLAAGTSTHLESATAVHRRASASLLDQSELHGGASSSSSKYNYNVLLIFRILPLKGTSFFKPFLKKVSITYCVHRPVRACGCKIIMAHGRIARVSWRGFFSLMMIVHACLTASIPYT